MIVLALTVLVALGTVFVSWQKFLVFRANNELSQKIETKIETIQSLAGKADASSYQKAAVAVEKADQYRVQWSKVVDKLWKLESENVRFLNFSSTPQKELSIQGIASNYEQIARFLEQLKQDPEIRVPFVSTIAEAVSEGNLPLTWKRSEAVAFQLQFSLSPSP